MNRRDYKSTDENESEAVPGFKTSPIIKHTLFHLKQIVGSHGSADVVDARETTPLIKRHNSVVDSETREPKE